MAFSPLFRDRGGAALMGILLAACMVLLTAAAAFAATDKTGYRLGSGDRVRVIVFGHPDLTGEFQVDGNGGLAYPLIGMVQAGGMTAIDLENAITQKLSPDFLKNPSVSVEVMTYRPFYIVGEVQKPGSYAYVSGMTVINAVALAGGFTYRAKEDDFYITRASDPSKKRQEASPFTEVLPGDVITVRERFF